VPVHETINYIEFPSRDLKATQAFFEKCFAWKFTDYGPEYTAFSDSHIDGGFFRADLAAVTSKGSALVVFYSEDLPGTLSKVQESGGRITKPIFSFPGGWRFHFTEPSGNEFGVWSDVDPSKT
jgi:predicted enzyme related to lactoylglutathione lyase